MKKHTQLERFLVFAYFGIDLNDEYSDEDIIRKCVERAYLDMCRTLKTDDQEWIETKEKLSKDLVNALLNNKSIQDKISKAYSVFFENDSEQLTESQISGLVDKNGDGICFYYGQAQKWINMSLKYMWLLGLIDDSQKAELEAPIDSYIIHKINHIPKNTAWSTLTIKEYNSIKDEITTCATEYSTVIDWEFNAWIEQAKEEKRIEQEKQKKKKSNNK